MSRFWQLKIHEENDRRGTKSTIEFGSDGDSVKDHAEVTKESTEDGSSKDGDLYEEEDDEVRSLDAPDRDYQYSYGGGNQYGKDPHQQYFTYTGRDRSMSVVSTISKNDWRGPSKDYQYSYGDEVYEERPRKSERSSVERHQRSSPEKKPERPRSRQSEEKHRKPEERKSERGSEKLRQSEERPGHSEERYRQSDERYRQSEEKSRQSEERYRQQSPERSRELEGKVVREKHPEGEPQKRKPEKQSERQPDKYDDRYEERQPERYEERKPDRYEERCPNDHHEGGRPLTGGNKRVNVNRRRPEARARGGDYTGSNYY